MKASQKENLGTYANGDTSQGGEEGIITEIMQRLTIARGSCVEFGAGDGKEISNTYHLWNDLGWDAFLIEANGEKFDQLYARLKEKDNPKRSGMALITCAMVTHDGPLLDTDAQQCGNTLDALIDLAQSGLKPTTTRPFDDIDVLSIDIDGNDYHVWKAFRKHTAKCVIIEHNAEFPPHISHHDPPGKWLGTAASARALVELGAEKGYTLVALTPTNVFFVRNDLMELVGDVCSELTELHDPNWCTYVISEMGTRRCWMTRKNPRSYYLEDDPKDRAVVPDMPLYPVHLHRADWDMVDGRFRILAGTLCTIACDENVYVHPEVGYQSVDYPLDRMLQLAKTNSPAEKND